MHPRIGSLRCAHMLECAQLLGRARLSMPSAVSLTTIHSFYSTLLSQRHAASQTSPTRLISSRLAPHSGLCKPSSIHIRTLATKAAAVEEAEPEMKKIQFSDSLTVQKIAKLLSVTPAKVLHTLADLDDSASTLKPHDAVTRDHFDWLAIAFNFEVDDAAVTAAKPMAAAAPLVTRDPVVTIMGHVDHGKTTLLDSLRSTNVAAKEAGGITQHIGAFSVTLPSSQRITFLDTPGHEAFSAMRARGANGTDIVVLVVAADDGVMPQTIESMKMANEARVPIIVAINKCDKPGVDTRKVKTELLRYGLQVEDLGGTIPCVELSALKKKGLDVLEEEILLMATSMDLKAARSGPARGLVIETRVARGEGFVSTVLVQGGELKPGAVILCGDTYCKVRAIRSDAGSPLKSAFASDPVEVIGWRDLPVVGDAIAEVSSEKAARDVLLQQAEELAQENAQSATSTTPQPQQSGLEKPNSKTLRGKNARYAHSKAERERIEEMNKGSTFPTLHVILRADVQGSEEAILSALSSMQFREVKLVVVSSGLGALVDTDIDLARTTGAQIFTFGVNVPKAIATKAEGLGLNVKKYRIIYEFLEEIQTAMRALLPPVQLSEYSGKAIVNQVFTLTGKKKGIVAGCTVRDGVLWRKGTFKVLRQGKPVHEGLLSSLKFHKEDVGSTTAGNDCGLSFAAFDEIEAGDVIECTQIREVPPTLTPVDPEET
eukprot:m.711186 g.711186  ORF g.711186 m.711186 type:complete len:715 (+) comp58769_c0_seq22:284-2428(+)